jgi:LysR family transcriptional regulator, nitrogen assimilation regulatory protein
METMDLKQIRCFVAAYEEGSFSKAAQREHCTQPGLSLYIQCLESMLSHRLFERKARGVTPTIAGRHFYACCTDILRVIGTSKQRMLELTSSIPTAITVGISPSISAGVLPWMLPDYLATHPYVDLRLVEANGGTLSDWVMSGEVDMAIAARPPVHRGLETSHFFRDRLVLVTRPDATHGRKRRAVHRNASDLGKLKLILPSAKHSLRQVVESAVRIGAAGSGRLLEIDGMLGTLELVQKSDWAAIVAGTAVAQAVKQGRLVAEPIYGPELWLDFYLIRQTNAVLSVACREFLQLLQETIKKVVGAPDLRSVEELLCG